MKLRSLIILPLLFSAIAQAGTWSVTAIPDAANPAPINTITTPNFDYFVRATRNGWAPSGIPTTSVSFDFRVQINNSTDGAALRVNLCSKDRWDNLGIWTCSTPALKASGSVIAVGTCTTNYCRPNASTLYFKGSTTYFNTWHNADNGGYIIKVRHVAATAPVATTLSNGTIINYY